jgi:hypothetical protein
MGLLQDLLHSVADAPSLIATAVVAGPRFTALAAGSSPDAPAATAGMAYTGAGEIDPAFDSAAATRELSAQAVGRPLHQLARQIMNGQGPLGAAALNALLAMRLPSSGLGNENGLDLIAHRSSGRRLAVVGQFPYLKTIRTEAVQSWVLELRPDEDELPADKAPEVIPQADVVGITGSTLANGTLEGLLALCRPDAFVVVIGPTTPLSPVLFDYGVDVVCGAVAVNPQELLAGVAVDRSTRRLAGTRQVSMQAERAARPTI